MQNWEGALEDLNKLQEVIDPVDKMDVSIALSMSLECECLF